VLPVQGELGAEGVVLPPEACGEGPPRGASACGGAERSVVEETVGSAVRGDLYEAGGVPPPEYPGGCGGGGVVGCGTFFVAGMCGWGLGVGVYSGDATVQCPQYRLQLGVV